MEGLYVTIYLYRKVDCTVSQLIRNYFKGAHVKYDHYLKQEKAAEDVSQKGKNG